MDDNTSIQFRLRLAQINEAHQAYVVRYGHGRAIPDEHEVQVKAKSEDHARELAHKKAKQKGHESIEIYSAKTLQAHKDKIESDKKEEIGKKEHYTNVTRAYLNARAKDENPLHDDAHVRACKAAAKLHPINQLGQKTHPYHVHMIVSNNMKSDTDSGNPFTRY